MEKIILFQPVVGLLDNIKSAPGLPISLITAAKLLVKEFELVLIDQRLDKNWQETLKKELQDKVVFFGTTAMLGPQVKYALEVSQYVKKISNVPVVWGGPFVSVLPDQALQEESIDIIIRGDGEITALELARVLQNNKSLEGLEGISYKKGNEIIKNLNRTLVDFNQMPDLPYHLVEIQKYLPKREGVPTIDMESSRGCPYNCQFCYNPAFNLRKWRAINPELVLQRIKNLRDNHGVRGVWFVDDEFFIDLKRARKIIEGLIELGIKWEIQGARADSLLKMDDEYLKLLEKSNCQQINIGAESGSARILKMVDKRITIEQLIEVNQKLKHYNFMPWYYFMIGFPTETEKEQDLTINLAMKLLKENPMAKISGIGCYTPYPGTALFNMAREHGYQPPQRLIDWSTYAVDQINIPWLKGKMKRRVEAIQFASFFVDQKGEHIANAWWIKLGVKLYRPIARIRFKHHFYGFPLDIFLGNIIKKKLAQ